MAAEKMITFGSVCSGIEAASVAFNPLGWRAAWFSEIEPFPCAVLAHRYPDVPNLGDMTTLADRVLRGEIIAPDVLCGGTPCQAFSVAGKRQSLDDERGNLTMKFVELANAIDTVRDDPCAILWENVPGVLSTKDNAFGCLLAGLAGEDCALQPPGGKWSNSGAVYGPTRAVAWRTLDAQYFGLAQRRRRVFVVASARDGFDPATVLFEWDGVRRDSAPSRETREGTSAGTLRSTQGGSDVDHGRAGHLIPSTGDISHCLNAGGMGRIDYETETFITHSLRSEGFDASEDGTGRGTPLVPVSYAIQAGALRTNPNSGPDGVGVQADHAYTLEARAEVQAVAFDTTQITSAANRSNPKAGDPCHPLAAGAHPPAIAFSSKDHGADATTDLAPTLRAINHADSHANGGGQMAVAFQERGREGSRSLEVGGDVAYALTAPNGGGRAQERNVLTPAMQVRRLTPRECERLQGFAPVIEILRIELCTDLQNKSVLAEIKCHRLQSSAWTAAESEYLQFASTAAKSSTTGRVSAGKHVAVYARQRYAGSLLVLRRSQSESNLCASNAGKQNWSRSPILDESFAAVLAPHWESLAREVTHGRAASHQSIRLSLSEKNGEKSAKQSGEESAESVNDAENDASVERFTTSLLGHVMPTCDSKIATSLCSVIRATSSFIQNETHDTNLCIDLVLERDYTAIPWRKKTASECPDGPRYKALGNSWAVPCVRWIGRRIDAELRK